MKVIGFEKIDGTTKDGRPYRGIKFYGTYQSQRVTGEKPATEYISERVIEEHSGIVPDIGDDLVVSYNRFGKVADYKITPQ